MSLKIKEVASKIKPPLQKAMKDDKREF